MLSANDIVIKFYEAFKSKDYKTMQSLYAINALFGDEVFMNLSGFETGKMWEMLLKSAKDLEVSYKILSTSRNKAKVKWEAAYTFTKTGRKVHNVVISRFEIEDGKIVTQKDKFNFGKWSRQSLGFFPWLISFTGITRKKVQEAAEISLNDFIRKNPSNSF